MLTDFKKCVCRAILHVAVTVQIYSSTVLWPPRYQHFSVLIKEGKPVIISSVLKFRHCALILTKHYNLLFVIPL